MSKKMTPAYFNEFVSTQSFQKYMQDYCVAVETLLKHIDAIRTKRSQGKPITKHLLLVTRQCSIDIERFGKRFRERTLSTSIEQLNSEAEQ